MIELQGTGGARGIAAGPVVHYRPVAAPVVAPFPVLRDRAVDYLRKLGDRLRAQGMPDEAAIFDAQALLAADPALEAAVADRVARGMTTAQAISAAVEQLAGTLDALPDPYLRERAADVRAVGSALLTPDRGAPLELPPGAILLAAELSPAETVNLPLQELAGLATATGAATSHTAILARSLGIPAVLGLGPALETVPDGTPAIVDGGAGRLILNPDQATRERYATFQAEVQAEVLHGAAWRDLPAETTDGRRIVLLANIGGPGEVEAALAAGAEGIGLFRTEFLFLGRPAPPTEDEQCEAYIAVLQRMAGRPVVVRTLDVGGDKPIPYLAALHEPNPFLGERGIRFSQRFPDLFHVQLRALLRAGMHGDLRIMLPMVATLADLEWGRSQLRAAAAALEADGVAHRADVPLGIMIETPAAAVMAGRLAEAGFFSIGTNDLAQYTLAADRTLAALAGRYRGNDPAVFRLIAMAVAGARRASIPVAVCGELAADPEAAEALLGLGVDELSMAPGALAAVKSRIRSTTSSAAEAAGRRACDE